MIVDDIIYFADNLFSDGIVAQAADIAVARGAAYFSSAGNDARLSYESAWRETAVATSGGFDLFRLSHPKGAPQAFSRQDVNSTAGTCQTLSRGPFIYSTDSLGATEGGSSGSPVLNTNGQVVGQLYGACGTNLNNVCDSASNRTVDGAMASYYPNVDEFLDPRPLASRWFLAFAHKGAS